MTERVFRDGEKVRLVVEVDVRHASNGVLHGTYGDQPDPNQRLLSVVYGEPGVTVHRVTPADGEPKPGQVWADRHGSEWFAVDGRRTGYGHEAVLVGQDGRQHRWQDLHTDDTYGPLALVRDVPNTEDTP